MVTSWIASKDFKTKSDKSSRPHNLIEPFHSRGQQLCKLIETKETFYIRMEFNSYRICFEHQHGRCFIVLEHNYGHRDVVWKSSIGVKGLMDVTGMYISYFDC